MRSLLIIIGIYQAANGVVMLVAPALWYASVPGVTATGPANIHFIRDIGLAFLAAGIALLVASSRPGDRAFIAVASIFPGGHALLHLAGLAAHGAGLGDAARDLTLIVIPGLAPPAALLLRCGEARAR